MQMLLRCVSIRPGQRVGCAKAIRTWLNVFVIKPYRLLQSITLATVVSLPSRRCAMQWEKDGGWGSVVSVEPPPPLASSGGLCGNVPSCVRL